MSGEKPYLSGLGSDERSIIEEMIHNPHSRHWEACNTFVTRRVYAKVKGVPRADQEEIIQEIMYRTAKYLPTFRFECSLKSWLHQIIEHCITDKHRKFHNKEFYYPLSINTPDEKDGESEETLIIEGKSTEEIFEIHEELRNSLDVLFEYAANHSKSARNRRILEMVIVEGYAHVEVAKKVGCDAAVVGYVVREAQRYVREKMREEL